MPSVKAVRLRDVLNADLANEVQLVRRWTGLFLVLHAWIVILACLALAGLVHPAFAILFIPIVGGRQLGLAILMHEASHGLLSSNRTWNDLAGRWLAGAPVGADLPSYRTYHFRHHRFTQQEEDPDLVLSAPFPVSRASFVRKVLRDLSGLTFLKQKAFLALSAFRSNDEKLRAVSRRTLAGWLATNAVISLASLFLLGWPALALWWLSQAMWLPFALRIRNIAEHACTTTSVDPFSHARTTRASLIERMLVAPYWVNYHAEHHLFMGVPCYRLPAVHAALREAGHHNRMTIASSYREVIAAVVQPTRTKPV